MDTELYKDWEQLSPYVYRKWVDDRKIVIYKVLNATRRSVDAWADGILETYNTWDTTQPYLAIYDMTAVLTMTPYARIRIHELVETAKSKQIKGRYGIVITNFMISNIIRLFVRRELDRQNSDFVREFFSDQDAALEWLRQVE